MILLQAGSAQHRNVAFPERPVQGLQHTRASGGLCGEQIRCFRPPDGQEMPTDFDHAVRRQVHQIILTPNRI